MRLSLRTVATAVACAAIAAGTFAAWTRGEAATAPHNEPLPDMQSDTPREPVEFECAQRPRPHAHGTA
jgi:hypothetical protein